MQLGDNQEGKDEDDDVCYHTQNSAGDTCNGTGICPIGKGFDGECRGDGKRLGEKPGIPAEQEQECHHQRKV